MPIQSGEKFLVGFCFGHPILSVPPTANQRRNSWFFLYLYPTGRNLCSESNSNKESIPNEFPRENAYDVLRVSETSSFAEIKASFRKLAKETHPDLACSHDHPSASKRFVQILAAYEILSDSERRAHYDRYLFSQRKVVQQHFKRGSTIFTYESHLTTTMEQMEVVEWLQWYRFAINDILSQKKVIAGSGYFDILEGEFYAALHRAYYGPIPESMDLLPDCFEAEERSAYGTSEVLHLVSGRDLFGIIQVVNEVPQLSHACSEKLTSFTSLVSGLYQSAKDVSICKNSGSSNGVDIMQVKVENHEHHASDVYKDLELYISGRVVAVATRIPPKSYFNGIQNEDSEDHIHVFLTSHDKPMYACAEMSPHPFSGSSFGSRILLGTITGIGTSPEEGSCFVYNNNGTKTHEIIKHRTLLVKHMHWYQVREESSVCECRCSRAQLPPSKFWLFEPRCSMHDIGGWYVETFGKDKKGRTIPSQRKWDGFDAIEHPEKRLHPAMYLLALAYRTLDVEDAKRRKLTFKDIIEPKLFGILRWCKKFVS